MPTLVAKDIFGVIREMFREKTLYEEQLATQHFSNKFRSIEDYDARLAAVGCSFRIREYLNRRTSEGTVRWADVPSGLGVALQQGVDDYGKGVQPVGIDLIFWDENILAPKDLKELEKRYEPGKLARLLQKESFEFIQGDMHEAEIPDGADFITAMCGLYYHDDPLGVWENLFNQLRCGGTLVAHFMIPKKNRRLIDSYRRFASALNLHGQSMLYFSEDGRDVHEAVLIFKKENDVRLGIRPQVRSVMPYEVSGGRHGKKFRIKVTDYEFA